MLAPGINRMQFSASESSISFECFIHLHIEFWLFIWPVLQKKY